MTNTGSLKKKLENTDEEKKIIITTHNCIEVTTINILRCIIPYFLIWEYFKSPNRL